MLTDNQHSPDRPPIVIAGNPEEFHVGAHFARAAVRLGLNPSFCDFRAAYAGSSWLRAVAWRCGRRPLQLTAFSRNVVSTCCRVKPMCLLTTGVAPVRSVDLAEIGREGVVRINFLTDDPWNPAHYAGWFLASLREYDYVFSPRRANLNDLERHGCKQVHYLPFAYSPDLHFPEKSGPAVDAPDVMFAGGADIDRLPYVRTLTEAKFAVALYGGYWNKYANFKPYWYGDADMATLRRATGAAKIVLCLVRRSNRDGHSMRTFEVPAMHGCMLVEDTPDHRSLFGPDGDTVVYFKSMREMIDRAGWLLRNDDERKRLATAAHARITRGHHTYVDRLARIIEVVNAAVPSLTLQ